MRTENFLKKENTLAVVGVSTNPELNLYIYLKKR